MSSANQVGVLSIGDELLAGAHPDLNAPYIAARLAEHGREVREVRAVADDEEAIAAALLELSRSAELVFVSGGLGPTEDDVTRHGVARAAGRELVFHEPAWETILEWYARSGRVIPESNRRQALMPKDATLIPNCAGTAPGFRVPVGGATVTVLPGPPREVEAVWEAEIEPWLSRLGAARGARAVRRVVLADLSESVFADAAGNWIARGVNPLVGVTVKGGVLTCRVIAHAPDEAGANALAQGRADELAERFADNLVSRDGKGPAEALAAELLERNLSVAIAESCTGGLVAGALTAVPGISRVFSQSWVTYSYAAKSAQLDVPADLLTEHGAVSGEVVLAMARGAAQRAGARLAIAISGIAGPDGGTPDKPVGLVWFGFVLDGEARAIQRRFPAAGRDRVRTWAVTKALFEALRWVRE